MRRKLFSKAQNILPMGEKVTLQSILEIETYKKLKSNFLSLMSEYQEQNIGVFYQHAVD